MFIISRLKDTVQIQAHNFGKDREVALKDELNKKYANKVLPQVGLCVALFDIEESSEGIILYGDGCVYHKVIFRIIVFKPFIDEVVLGKVARSSKEGIRVTLGFFDDCWIPDYRLPPNCSFDAARSEFFWAANAEDGATRAEVDATPEDERFYIIAGEVIRIRVLAEEFYDVMPKVAPKVIQPAQGGPTQTTATPTAAVHSGPPPYRLQEAGLGLLDWWKAQDAEM
ncbi:DNA-directed RNA polymerase III complex subunit Rpc25 [Cystobasidiomycetes sp. EMM_F5]